MRFQNKTVAITGGNSGIGLATAIAFKNQGANVAIFGRNAETLAAAKEAHGFLAVQGDVTNRADLDTFFAATKDQFGKVDVVFSNAGIAEFLPFEAADAAHLDRTLDINVKGVFHTVQAALSVINNPASIILTTSVANVTGDPNMSVYAASKAAVSTFARTLSTELLPKGIRVNSISPGPTDTPIFDKMGMDAETTAATKAFIKTRMPVGRMGTAADIANAVLFLASDESAFIVGTEITADGGFINCATA